MHGSGLTCVAPAPCSRPAMSAGRTGPRLLRAFKWVGSTPWRLALGLGANGSLGASPISAPTSRGRGVSAATIQATHSASPHGQNRNRWSKASNEAIPQGNGLEGTVERVTFCNEDNGWSVLRVAVTGRKGLVTVVGHAGGVSAGHFITVTGTWVTDPNYGLQMRADAIQLSSPVSSDGMAKYLSSGMIKGIGPVYGQRLVDLFGDQVFHVIENEPHRLLEVKGIGSGRQQKISNAWKEQEAVREIMIFLHSHGCGSTYAYRVYKRYGGTAIGVVKKNPYRLAQDIRGIGFKTADKVARSLGMDQRAPERCRAGVRHTLSECTLKGHTGLPCDILIESTAELLQVEPELVEQAIAHETEAASIVRQTLDGVECRFSTPLFRMESAIATKFVALAQDKPSWPQIDIPKAIEWVQTDVNIKLGESQKAALTQALTSKVVVITGGPGVGKTTLLKSILRVLSTKKVTMKLAAPTGRAAKRLNESTGLPASTLHRLLESGRATDGKDFARNETNPLECELLVVDEASMVDINLMSAVMKALPSSAALFLVGDIDQLPSVGPGRVLGDVIDSQAVPVVRLTEVFRQAAGSLIITNAHRINKGEQLNLPEAKGPGSDFYVWAVSDSATAEDTLVEVVTERIPQAFGFDSRVDIQVLTPRIHGTVGTKNLNTRLQEELNPPRRGVPSVVRNGYTFRPGDKVMNMVNDHEREVYNGDLGVVELVDETDQEVHIQFDSRPEKVVFDYNELDAVELAYATTIHKSQGSEFPVVVMPFTMQAYTMLQRNLLYTGVTRGKKLVVLVAEPRALEMAISNRNVPPRYSKLKDLIHDASASQGLSFLDV